MLRSAISARPSLSSSTLASTSKLSNNAFSTSTRIRQAAPAPEQPKMVKLTVDGKEVEVVQGCVTVEMEMSKSKSDPHSTSLTPFSFSLLSSLSWFYRTALIQACEKAGAQIPRFCYHERVSTRFNSNQSKAALSSSPEPYLLEFWSRSSVLFQYNYVCYTFGIS